MKKKMLFFVICILTFQSVSAQDEIQEFEGEIKWSELFTQSKYISSPDIIGQDGEFVYLTRVLKKKTYIEKYNMRTLVLSQSMELDLTYNDQKLKLLSKFMFNDRPVLYTSFYNEKTKTNYCFVQTIDKSTLIPSKPIVVSQVVRPKSKGIISNMNMASASESGELSTNFLVSENKSLGYTLELNYADQLKKDDPLVVSNMKGKLLDENLKIIVENDFMLPYPSFSIIQTKLSNDGLIYMAGYQMRTEKSTTGIIRRDVNVYGNLEVLVLDLESGEIEVLDVSLGEERVVKSFTFKIDSEGAIIISGLTGGSNSGVSGGFYAKYNASLKEEAINFVDFEEDFITQDWSEKSKEKLEKQNEKNESKGEEARNPNLYNYKIRDLIVKPDGTSTLLAEQYYVREVTRTYTTSNGGTRTVTTYYYYYKDIIALNFDDNGDLVWKTVIDKYQMSTNDGGYYSSFFTILDGNDINIIYNDRESNAADTEGMTNAQIKALRRTTVGVRVLLNEEGGQAKEKLFEFEEGGLRLVPKVCESAGDQIGFLYARSTKGDKIGIVEW